MNYKLRLWSEGGSVLGERSTAWLREKKVAWAGFSERGTLARLPAVSGPLSKHAFGPRHRAPEPASSILPFCPGNGIVGKAEPSATFLPLPAAQERAEGLRED